jgi:Ca2+/H+ antiporter, TMEM165/GDT1 family
MMFHGQERGKGFWIKRAIFIPIAIAAGVFVFGSVVMLLWNALLPAVFGFKVITFWQALGLLVLSKILFGGFRGGYGHHRFNGHLKWHGGRFMHLSPEEREKMRAEWRGRCEPQVKQE